jgi:hypothetical protein
VVLATEWNAILPWVNDIQLKPIHLSQSFAIPHPPYHDLFKAVSRQVLQGYLLVHAVRVLELVVDRAQLGVLDTAHANRLLAQHLFAQLDAVWAVALIALRALEERIPLFHTVGLLGSQACNSLLCLALLVNRDDVVLRDRFALGGQLGEPAAA